MSLPCINHHIVQCMLRIQRPVWDTRNNCNHKRYFPSSASFLQTVFCLLSSSHLSAWIQPCSFQLIFFMVGFYFCLNCREIITNYKFCLFDQTLCGMLLLSFRLFLNTCKSIRMIQSKCVCVFLSRIILYRLKSQKGGFSYANKSVCNSQSKAVIIRCRAFDCDYFLCCVCFCCWFFSKLR